jgi:riboflavin biosynthesis pyrimidine reductase
VVTATPGADRSFRLRRVVPEGPDVDPAHAYAVAPGTTWLRANMVSSADGAITGPDHRSAGVSSPADQYVFGVLRRLTDVVLVGAGTARIEGYHPARVPIALVSARLELDLASALLADSRTIVYTAQSAGADRIAATSKVADVVVCGESLVDLGIAVADLRARGYARVLCEGGPTLLGSVLGHGLLDELCLTISPVLVGGTIARIIHGTPLAGLVHLELAHLLEAEGSLFARYVVRRDAGSG